MILSYCIHIPIIVAICWFIKKKFSNNPLADFFLPAVLIKLLAGIGVGLLYSIAYSKYHGDTFAYQEYASELTAIFKKDSQEYFRILFVNKVTLSPNPFEHFMYQPRIFFLVKLISVLNFFTFSNYWINSLYFSLFSFYGLWLLASSLFKNFHISKQALLFSFFLFPSFAFWSSGLLKESLVIGIIGIITMLYIQFQFHKIYSIPKIILFLILLIVGCILKYYYFMVLLLCMIAFSFSSFIQDKQKIYQEKYKLTIFFVTILSMIGLLIIVIPPSVLSYSIEIMFISYEHILRATQGQNYFTFHHLQPTLISYLENSPTALMAGLLRPFISEAHGFLAVLIGIENMVIYILIISGIYERVKSKNFSLSPMAAAIWAYVIITAVLMAFIAPTWGTLSRYKAGFLFFYILLLSEGNPLLNYLFDKLILLKKKISQDKT